MSATEVPKVLILGNAYKQGYNEKVFGPNVQTLDVMAVEGTSIDAQEARSRHFQLDLDDVPAFNDFIDAHRNEFTIIVFDFAVWKFIENRFRMIRLVQALKSGGKLYITGAESPRGGIINWLPPGKTPWDQSPEERQSMKNAVLLRNVQQTAEIFERRAIVRRVQQGRFQDLVASEEKAVWPFLQKSALFQKTPDDVMNSILVVVEKV